VPACRLKLVLVCPAGIRYADCTGSATVFPLDTLTSAPSGGAAPLSVRLNVAVPSEVMAVGLTAMAVKATAEGSGEEAGVSIRIALWLLPA